MAIRVRAHGSFFGVPTINGEFEFIAAFMPEVAESD